MVRLFMLKETAAHQFKKPMGSGRTRPCLLGCSKMEVCAGEIIENEDEELDLVVKFSGGCDRGTNGLIAEVLAASLAADLELLMPEPFLVLLDPEFIKIIPDPDIRKIAERSSRWAYGTKLLPPQFSTFSSYYPEAGGCGS